METDMRKGFGFALFVAALSVFFVPGSTAYADCGSPANAIQAENCLPGDPPSEWDISGASDPGLRGFATDVSVNRGEMVSFKVSTTATAYRIDIYRLGYYGGDGARKIATIPDTLTAKTNQPACRTDTTGLGDCGNWPISASWAVPARAVSGIYVARLVGEAGVTGASHVVFVVRDDGGTSDLLFQTSSSAGRTFNRSLGTRATALEGGLFHAEYPMVRWLERNGYDVSYFTAMDAERRGGEILGHRVYLSAGLDTAWSPRQRASIEAALDHDPPVHLAFFGAHAASGPGARRTPENALTGTIFSLHGAESALEVSEADGRMRFWRDTPNVATLAPGAVWTGPAGTLGREWGEDRDDPARPAGLVRLATRVDGTAAHHAVFHKRASGALVFSAGTRQWAWGLDASVDMQQATANLLADMGAQPATLQDGLVPASASTDVVAPVSDVTSPALGAMVARLSPVLIEGAATDGAPGQVGGVEVSVDGGLTWHRAEGRESWSYLWTPPADGTYVILSRAVDDSGNLETPGAGLALGVGRAATRFAARAPNTRDFVTAAAGTFTDDVQADFNLGTKDTNIAVTAVSGGEVQLAGLAGSAEFDVVPANWTSTPWPAGTPVGLVTVAGGQLVVDGALANTISGLTYGPGTTLEFLATFGAAAFQNVGFGAGADGDIFNSTPPAAMFGTSNDGTQVLARVWTSGLGFQDTVLGIATDGVARTYRIVWQTTGFEFYVNNVLAHTQATPVAGPMRIAVSDFTFGGPAVSVDWVHVLSYPATGTFVSRVFDSTAAGTSWKAMTWTADTPAGTTLSMSARISTSAPPTGAWIPISGSGTILGGTARYVQYRAVLSTTNALVTPVLRSVSIAYDTTVGDTTPPAIVSRTPLPGATGVPIGSAVTVQFGEVVNAATITTATFRLRAVGASTDVAAAVVTSGNIATLTPSAALTVGTYYTVTLGATVADLSGNPLGADVVWTFATATPSFTDTALADFQAALSNTCALGSYESEGDVLLTPNAGSGFDTGALPTGWVVTPWSAGGVGTVASAVLTVDGARVDSGTTQYTPRTLEFVATFGAEAFQALGWGTDLNLITEGWALFGTALTNNTLYARTNDGTGTVDVAIPGSWIGSSHTYRIDWTASQVVYSIDGTAVHTAAIAVPGPLRPVISDLTPTPSPATLAVSGFRISPFTTPCTLQSRVVDAGFAVSWSGLTWTAAVPAQTTLAVSVRSGNVAVPDGTWTAYTTVPSSGAIVSGGVGRYAQYRAVLTATNTTRTPVVSNVTINSVAPPTQVLTVTLPANGTITGTGINCGTGGSDCAETYAYGTVVALTATPNTGYSLSTWTGACTLTGACSVNMTAARTVGATFAVQRLALTVTAPTNGGTITSNPAGINCGTSGTACTASFDYNTVVALTATPSTGYNFGNWTGDCTGTTNTCSLTMTAARTVGATFTIQRYTLTVTSPTNGTITSNPAGINCGTGGTACTAIYDYGTVVPLTATPATGYGLSTWTGICSGTGACSATMTADRTVGATFAILRLTLTVTPPTNGTVTGTGIVCGAGGSDCSEVFDYGTGVPLTATPSANYDFAGWTGACTGAGACAPTMTAARTVGASFTIQRFTLTVGAPTGGTITASGINCGAGGADCSEVFDYGTVVALTATPATGYDFGGWTGDCAGTGACSVTMSAARAVGAIFTIQRYTLTVTPPTNGTITGTGIACGTGGADCSEIFNYGTAVPLTATPATGYSLGAWTGACTGAGACAPTMTAARTVGATFTIQRFTLTVTKPTHGTITGTGIACGTGGNTCSAIYDYATVVPLTATPDTGYDLGGWTGACSGTGACSATMTAARTVGATFTIQRYTLTVTTPTHGTVTGTGITCGTGGSTCSATYDYATVVPLTASPDANYNFGGWTGACTGTGACSVTMTAAQTVGATFTIQRYTLTVTTPTHGRITATGISCGAGGVDCTEAYDYGSVVPLTATPDAGYGLRAWTGVCSGTSPCSVTVDANKSVGGLFALIFQQRKGDPSPYTGPGFVTNESAAAPREVPPDVVTEPVRPPESEPPSAPEPKLEPTPVPKSAPEPKLELAPKDSALRLDLLRVFVAGAVRNPGAYVWFPGLTARQLISLAGGLTPEGSGGRLEIVREEGGLGREGEVEFDALVTAGQSFVVRPRVF
jgi:hypothetical protein